MSSPFTGQDVRAGVESMFGAADARIDAQLIGTHLRTDDVLVVVVGSRRRGGLHRVTTELGELAVQTGAHTLDRICNEVFHRAVDYQDCRHVGPAAFGVEEWR